MIGKPLVNRTSIDEIMRILDITPGDKVRQVVIGPNQVVFSYDYNGTPMEHTALVVASDTTDGATDD